MKEPEIRKADVSTELELPMYDAIASSTTSVAPATPPSGATSPKRNKSLMQNKARITASLIQCYAPTPLGFAAWLVQELVAPSAVSIADAIDTTS